MRPELRNLLIDTRFWLTAAAGTLLALVALGLLIGILANPLVVRTVATRSADIAVWLASAPLIGLTLARYVVRSHRVDHRDRGRLDMGAGSLAVYFAIACPVCNKLVLLAVGFFGALNVLAPIQSIIGIASLAFLAGTLSYRLRKIGPGCERCAGGPAEAEG